LWIPRMWIVTAQAVMQTALEIYTDA